MTDFDAIFEDIVPKSDRLNRFREYVIAYLPQGMEMILISETGSRIFSAGLQALTPEQEAVLLKQALADQDEVLFYEPETGLVSYAFLSFAGACLIVWSRGLDREVALSLIRLLDRGFQDQEGLRDQERLIQTRNLQYQREKRILETKNREILAKNFSQHEQYAKMLESEIKRQTKDLVEARQHAESASRAKSEFLANMSHEIRTPMNGVIGMLEILSETPLTRDQQIYVESTRQSAHSLLTLINDILDFSKVEAGKLDIEQIAFNLATTLDAFLDFMGPRAREKNLELAMIVEQDVPLRLIGDPTRIRQILLNLVGNALKFTQDGHVFVRVSCESQSRRRCCLLFEVLDTGMGIPEDKIGTLFHLFSQVDSSTTRKFGGTGLGLAISQRLSRLMGGDIGVTSTLGKGARFWFTIRAEKEAGGAKEDVFPVLAPLRILAACRPGIHDKVFKAYLQEFNADFSLVSDGEAALQALESAENETHPFDIVLADLDLPAMPGNALCREVSERFSPAVPVLLLPEHLPGMAEKYEQDAAHFLFKPVKKRDLFLCLRLASGHYQAPVMKPPKTSAVTQQDRSATRSLNILLAEDNAVNQKVATIMLKSAGHRVVGAEDGEEAISLYKAGGIDLILMDIQMPVMDGEEACKAIREMESPDGSRIPIVALTANAMKGDRERYLASGMDAYIAKPIQKEILLNTIHSLIP